MIYSNTDGPRDCHPEWDESKTNIVWYDLYVKSKKKLYKRTYLQNKLTELENELMVSKGKDGGEE